MSGFSAETYQNEYLAAGGSEVNAVVTVTSSDAGAPELVAAGEVVIIDTSGSMTGRKLRAAIEATEAAISCIRDGVFFGVVSGTDRARMLYPRRGGLATASSATRAEAIGELRDLEADGGTAIGTWLTRANELFATVPQAIHHAILLTDGRNESESPDELGVALEACLGRFQCDCRGVGTDWEVAELRRIASALLGTVDIVAEPEGLEADFRALVERSMGKGTADVSLRLWTPQGASVAFVKQVSPTIEDLTDRARPVGPLTVEYPTGSWGEEEREYHLAIRVPPREVGEEMLAGRFSLVVGEEVLGQALIKAIWTDDEQLSTRINPEVAHYTGQAELAEVIQEGLEARKAGDDSTATFKLGRAVQLAAASGHDDTLRLLEQVVEVEDAATGTVSLRRSVADADEMALDTRSTRSVRAERDTS